MNKKLLTVATLSLLLAGQTAVAKDNAEEFLSWLNEGQNAMTVQVDTPLQYNKVSIRHDAETFLSWLNTGEETEVVQADKSLQFNNQTNYDAKSDFFSLDFSSKK